MLLTFCAAAKMKALLQQPGAPNVVKEASNILKRCCGASGGEALEDNINIFHSVYQGGDEKTWNVDGSVKMEDAHAPIKRALAEAGIKMKPDAKLEMFASCTISGVRYTTQAKANTNCNIFFSGSGGHLVPGIIEHIFTIPSANDIQNYFFAARRNLPIPTNVTDPFQLYKDFGTGLWRDKHRTELDIFPVTESTYCHAISMLWEDEIVVMKPLDRVSDCEQGMHKLTGVDRHFECTVLNIEGRIDGAQYWRH
jgi:hypothetical protein